MLEQWISDPGKVGVTALLLGAVYMIYKILMGGLAIPRWTFDLIIKLKDEEIDKAHEECKFHKDMNERLLAQLEKTVRVAEVATETTARK